MQRYELETELGERVSWSGHTPWDAAQRYRRVFGVKVTGYVPTSATVPQRLKDPTRWVRVWIVCPDCVRASHKWVRRVGTTSRICPSGTHTLRIERKGLVLTVTRTAELCR